MKLTVRMTVAGLLTSAALLLTSTLVASASPATTLTGAAATTAPADRPCAAQWLAVSTDPSLPNLKALGDCEVNRRLTTLATLKARVTSWTALTTADRTALLAEIGTTASGLSSLESSIDSDATVPAAKADLARIAPDFRVYLLVAPQVHLVHGADAVLAATGRFGILSTTLANRVAVAKAAGKDVTAAQAALDAMNSNVAQASSLAAPLSAQLLPLTPALYNNGTAGPVLDHARDTELSARNLLKAARADAAACINDLR